ncbi:porin [Paracoccus xiamenensis]|uniref:porin n=1 Tax=Paracoccus xiamenensis TaxID=2714901 RepID=UPI001407476C|nr:porin [Paracoccus xiamenensis]NHF74351.1 porin [Paracoccus xiamenensis]
MKKVLFATTALVMSMTAGVAVAEVAVTGDARMGLIYDGNDAQFGSRARVRFTMTGESDAGLSFGASFRVDHQDNSGGKASDGTAGSVWISGTYGKLEMGDVVSASEAAIGDLYEVGYTEGAFGGDLEEFSYLTGDGNNLDQGPNILYSYSISGFNLFASASDASDNAWSGAAGADNPDFNEVTGVFDPETNDTDTDLAWSVGAAYEGQLANGTWSVGLGYGKHDEAEEIVLGGEVKSGAFMAKAIYADYSDRDSITFQMDGEPDVTLSGANFEYDKAYGFSLGYEFNSVVVKGYWRRDELNSLVAGVGDREYDSFGIGADYDLGGGAVLAGGIVDTDWAEDTVADIGIRFKF